MLKYLLIFVCAVTMTTPLYAQRKVVERSTDILMFAAPVAGFVGSLVIGDYKGTKQIVIGGASNLAASYILKYAIKKERPDGSNNHSFPSAHTSVAFQGATFLQKRYGWKCGVPAFAVAAYVGWGRTYAKKHDWWDVTGGAVLGTACGYIFTTPFAKKHNLTVTPVAFENGTPGIYASITF